MCAKECCGVSHCTEFARNPRSSQRGIIVIHANWIPSATKVFGKLYQWLVTERLRNRSEENARSAPAAAVIRSGVVNLHWYEWPAARQLQREGHGEH